MRLPKNFPDGTRYVVETHGAVIRRYVVFPSGRKINLSNRKAVRYACRESNVSVVADPRLTRRYCNDAFLRSTSRCGADRCV